MIEARELAVAMAGHMKRQIEAGQQADPVLFAHNLDDQVALISLEFPDELHKDIAAYAMRMLAKIPEVDYVLFLSECWMATIERKEQGDVDLSQGVRNYPGRTETIIASIFRKNGKPDVGSWPFLRDAYGKAVFSEKLEWFPENGSFEGRFVQGGEKPHVVS